MATIAVIEDDPLILVLGGIIHDYYHDAAWGKTGAFTRFFETMGAVRCLAV